MSQGTHQASQSSNVKKRLKSRLVHDGIYISRIAAWGFPTVEDNKRFPTRAVAASDNPYSFPERLDYSLFTSSRSSYNFGKERISESNFAAFLERNSTTSFIALKDGTIIYERYSTGYNSETPLASFSVTKLIVSALVGIAIERGLINSVHDRFTRHVPELASKDFDTVTIEHLLTMTCGMVYSRRQVPWSDDAKSYYSPDRWAMVLCNAQIGSQPSTVWNYNDYSPTIIGIILERVTGQRLAQFAEEVLFKPLGMTCAASWILDSSAKGLESAAAGPYCTARTLATFGQLYLSGGVLGGRGILSENWIAASTRITAEDSLALKNIKTEYFEADRMSYKYYWWVQGTDNAIHDFIAISNLGQYIYVSPKNHMIIVRTGRNWGDFGNTNWLRLLRELTADVN